MSREDKGYERGEKAGRGGGWEGGREKGWEEKGRENYDHAVKSRNLGRKGKT